MSSFRKSSAYSESALEQVHNYYERQVIYALHRRESRLDEDTFADLVCIALNELPAKYIRHEVDLVYFSDPAEIEAMKANVERAIDFALGQLGSGRWAPRG